MIGRFQEECTALRTQLISVKNSNGTLGDGLEQALSKAEGFKTRIVQLEAQLETFKVTAASPIRIGRWLRFR